MVLGRLAFIIISTKFSQFFTFIGRMSKSMDKAGFLFALQEVYISFTALGSALAHHGVSIIQFRFSSIVTNESSTFFICPSGFL